MAVGSTTSPEPDPTGPQGPIRTCIGCRKRAMAAELLRVVAAPGPSVVPDPQRRAPGRGAWLHRDPDCLDLAERRRAYGRSLRLSGTPDPSPVREYVAAQHDQEVPDSGTQE